MIDLNKPLDLKNIDINTIFGNLLKEKLVLAKIVAVIIGVVVLAFIAINFFKMKAEADNQMLMLRTKIETIASYNSSRKAFDSFLASLPKSYSDSDFVNAISDFAAASNVDVDSFSPVVTTNSTYVDTSTLQLTVTGKNFKDMVSFMRKMEDSNYSLRINNFSFSNIGDSKITMSLTVSSVKTNKR